ncbi:MAG: FeoB-associated Cys-rich membrane protein [Oscillospiraceae bacterium]|nr:FeoB-associated Cys-rich membrane protein [Oscillospiraceae bacterium]
MHRRPCMRPVDIVLIAIIAAVIAGAVLLAVKRKKSGSSCCGNCEKCRSRCSS